MAAVDHKRSIASSVLLHTTLVATSAIAVFPVLWVLAASFKPANRILSSNITFVDHPTLANYRHVLTETAFPTWFMNSVVVAAFTMLFGVFMAASAGYALSRFNFPGRR